MEDNFEQEKHRQLSHLEGEIKRRRDKKERRRRKQLEEDEAKAAKADDDKEKKQMQEIQQKQAKQLQQKLEYSARPSTPVHKKVTVLTDDASKKQSATITSNIQLRDFEISQLLMSTPLFSRLSDIHKMMQTKAYRSDLENTSDTKVSDDRSYIDLKDAQWECKGELVPVNIQDLKPSDFVVYRFGLFIANLIYKQSQSSRVSLLIASNLPPNNYTHNCFRNSFFYQHSKNTLFIRKERLESVGEFVVVIAHCLSHVRIGDLVYDSNPLFLREFYQVSQVWQLLLINDDGRLFIYHFIVGSQDNLPGSIFCQDEIRNPYLSQISLFSD